MLTRSIGCLAAAGSLYIAFQAVITLTTFVPGTLVGLAHGLERRRFKYFLSDEEGNITSILFPVTPKGPGDSLKLKMAFKRLNMFYENKKQETTEIVVVGESGNKALFCYLAVWSIYRHGNGMFRTSDLEADLCTHFVYAYLGINETTYEIASIDDWGDNKHENVGMVAKVVDLKKENPNLKVLVSVGGWSEGSIKFSTIAASAGKRRKFIDSVFNYLKAKNLDGIEIAWLIPTMRGGTDEDKANFVTLLEELSEKLRPSGLLVVVFIAGATTPAGVASRYDLANMAPAVDYMNLVVSEFHGFWDKVTGISSPLYSEDKKNIVDIVSYALRAGVPAGKILMRFSTYGQTFVMKFEPTDNVYLNVSAPETFKGPWSNQDGFMGFNEICWELLKGSEKDQWVTYRDEESSTPFSVNGRKFVSFDDAKSFKEKLKYLNAKDLGGVSLYSLDTDDFRGLCYDGTKYPLTNILRKEFGISVNKIISVAIETVDW